MYSKSTEITIRCFLKDLPIFFGVTCFHTITKPKRTKTFIHVVKPLAWISFLPFLSVLQVSKQNFKKKKAMNAFSFYEAKQGGAEFTM